MRKTPPPRAPAALPRSLPAGPALAAAALAVALLGAGCGSKTTGPAVFDNGGGHLIVFASDRNQAAGQFRIFCYDLDLLGFRLLAGLSNGVSVDSCPSMTSDGQLIAFVSTRNGGVGGTDILVYERLSASFVSVPNLNTPFDEAQPEFTGDTQSLALVRDSVNIQHPAGVKRVLLYDAARDTMRRLPGLTAGGDFNDWSPSPDQTGHRIAFVSDRNGNPDVFVWDADSGAVLTLPDLRSSSDDLEPSLTPGGNLVTFASNRPDTTAGYNIYLYDLQARAFIGLPGINTAGDDRHPSISRDGNIIVLQSDRTGGAGKRDVWNYSRLTNTAGMGPGESNAADDIQPFLRWN